MICVQEETLYIGTVQGENYKDIGNYLTVFGCGVQHPVLRRYHSLHKTGRLEYHLLYIESGTARLYYEGNAYQLSKGQFNIYPPGHPQEYLLEKGTVSYWVHFHGTYAEKMLSDCGLTGGVYTAEDPVEAGKLISQLLHVMKSFGSTSDLQKNALFLSILCALTQKTETASIPDSVWPAVRYLQKFYNKNPSTEILADICNLSRSHFLYLFKEFVGTTPHQYLLSIRIEQAKRLLSDSTFSVSDISSMVGFEDSFYFSRIFKKITGVTPREYRKNLQANL